MITSNSHHHTIFVLFHRFDYLTIDLFQHTIQQSQISQIMLILLFIFLFILCVRSIDVSQIDSINPKFSFNSLRQLDLPHQIRSLGNTFNRLLVIFLPLLSYNLTLPYLSTQKQHILCISPLYLLNIHIQIITKNNKINNLSIHNLTYLTMFKILLVMALSATLTLSMLETPEYWLKKGFDITDGKLQEF